MTRMQAHLNALAFLRKQQSHHLTAVSMIGLIASLLFVASWIAYGIDVAVYSTLGLVSILAWFGKNSPFMQSWIKKRDDMQERGRLLEELIYQRASEEVAPWIHFSLGAPEISSILKSSDLVRDKIEFVVLHGSLSGVFDGTAFCAAFADAGYYETYRNSDNVLTQTPKSCFRGLFLVMDFPREFDEPVTIESEKIETTAGLPDGILEPFLWFKTNYPRQNFTLKLHRKTLTALLPMSQNPMAFNNNSQLWPEELLHFEETATMTKDFVQTVASLFPASQSEVA